MKSNASLILEAFAQYSHESYLRFIAEHMAPESRKTLIDIWVEEGGGISWQEFLRPLESARFPDSRLRGHRSIVWEVMSGIALSPQKYDPYLVIYLGSLAMYCDTTESMPHSCSLPRECSVMADVTRKLDVTARLQVMHFAMRLLAKGSHLDRDGYPAVNLLVLCLWASLLTDWGAALTKVAEEQKATMHYYDPHFHFGIDTDIARWSHILDETFGDLGVVTLCTDQLRRLLVMR
jgi:hypothetical protein